MNNEITNTTIKCYNEITEWFVHDFNFENATNINLSFDNINDFDFTITFLVDNYFKCTINYISGRSSFLLDIYDTRYDETILHYLTYCSNCNTMHDALTHCLVMFKQLIDDGAY